MSDTWKSRARCLPKPKGVEFHWDKAPHPEQAAKAMRVCAGCPVIDECLADMKSQQESYRYQVRAHREWWRKEERDVVYLGNVDTATAHDVVAFPKPPVTPISIAPDVSSSAAQTTGDTQ